MDLEPEIKALNDIYNIINDLDHEARRRVLHWINERFASELTKNMAGQEIKGQESPYGASFEIKSFNSIVDIFSKARPKNDAEKVLIVASYLQENKHGEELTAREINMRLNLLGHGVRNITSTIGTLIKKRPQLMIQTRKEGKTRQAQKRYRVTAEGFAAAAGMIN